MQISPPTALLYSASTFMLGTLCASNCSWGELSVATRDVARAESPRVPETAPLPSSSLVLPSDFVVPRRRAIDLPEVRNREPAVDEWTAVPIATFASA